ncbi:MAG: DUF177 domain-containing protein [Pseudomonadota bacterium]
MQDDVPEQERPALQLTALDWTVRADRIGGGGHSMDRTATDEERTALCQQIAVPSVDDVKANLLLQSTAAGAAMTGHITARLTLTCGVTLDPVTQVIAEEVDVAWHRNRAAARDLRSEATVPEDEIGYHALAEDDPEPIVNGIIDVGRYVAERIASAVDPFPRADGAALDVSEAAGSDEPEEPSPFAVLKSLQTRANDGSDTT